MEESKALSKLSDATDLLMLLEDILTPASIERLSQASWSGIRLTLKNARTTLQDSQATLSKEFVSRARNTSSVSPVAAQEVPPPVNAIPATPAAKQFVPHGEEPGNVINASMSNFGGDPKAQITRRDLKASLEKFIENR